MGKPIQTGKNRDNPAQKATDRLSSACSHLLELNSPGKTPMSRICVTVNLDGAL
jgi:hypothetical protein